MVAATILGGPTLGTGENRAFIYERGGKRKVGELDGTSQIVWGRNRSAISQAQAAVNIASASSDCCGVLGKLDPWAYEMVVFRDQERVWEGPITNVTHSRGSALITGKDVLGWTAKRQIKTARITTVPATATSEMLLSIQRAFASGNDPNVLAYVNEVLGGPAEVLRAVAVDSGMYDADLTALAGLGGNFTVIGRSIILWTDGVPLGQTATLNTDAHLLSDVQVVLDGDNAATASTAVNDDASASTVVADGAGLAYYGLLESLVTAPSGTPVSMLPLVARGDLRERYPLPASVVVPNGAVMSPDAPFPLRLLVPGVYFPVVSTETCRRVQQTMVLDSMTVTAAAGTEQVAINLVALDGPDGEEG